jgi:tetratricopeptide (TPR) repeat protein
MPVLALLAIGALTYLNALPNAFVLDDRSTILENAQIRDLTSLEVLRPEAEQTVAGRPLVNLSLALNYAVGGSDPRGYHATNAALHILCAVLLYAVARRLWRRARPAASPGEIAATAFGCALLWLVHPLNSEVVNYITQRSESVMAACYLAMLYAALRAAEAGSGRWTAAAIAACWVGMGAKESMVTAPVAVVLVDRAFIYPSLREAWRARRGLYLGLAAGWLLLAGLLAGAPRTLSAGFATDIDIWTYLLNQAPMILRYLRLVVWPSPLVANYGWPLPIALVDVLPHVLAVMALIALAILGLARAPRTGALGAWVFLTLAPTSSILPIATEVGAERRMYLPLMALIALVVWLLAAAWTRLRPQRLQWLPVAVAALAATALAVTTVQRNREYRTDLGLRQITLARYPSAAMHHAVAFLQIEEGQREAARPHLLRALDGDPRAHYTLAVELFRDNQLDPALEHFQRFIDRQPRLRNVVAAHGFRGEIFELKEDWPAAAAEYRAVLAIEPDNVTAHRRLGDALVNGGQPEAAVAHYRACLSVTPQDAGLLNQLGLALGMASRLPEAVSTLQRAVSVDPGHAQARYNLALALWQNGDTRGALAQAREAATLQPDNEAARTLLAQLQAGSR